MIYFILVIFWHPFKKAIEVNLVTFTHTCFIQRPKKFFLKRSCNLVNGTMFVVINRPKGAQYNHFNWDALLGLLFHTMKRLSISEEPNNHSIPTARCQKKTRHIHAVTPINWHKMLLRLQNIPRFRSNLDEPLFWSGNKLIIGICLTWLKRHVHAVKCWDMELAKHDILTTVLLLR